MGVVSNLEEVSGRVDLSTLAPPFPSPEEPEQAEITTIEKRMEKNFGTGDPRIRGDDI
jgi:hypothetical protein